MTGATAYRFNRHPLRAPRVWAGMTLGVWCHALARHRFRVHPSRWAMAAIITAFALVNSGLGRLQRWRYGRRLRGISIDEAPVFVLGHWRSGTTYLHELLALDARFAAPTTYAAFAPHGFLVSEALVTRLFPWIAPRRRVMDDIAVGLERPQEDEWALCNLGLPSPYLRILFPNEPPPFLEYLDMQGVPAAARARWQRGLLDFLRAVTLRQGGRLVLKSPAHTGRVGVLLELFPRAKFVHIVRDPFDVFASTMRMWEGMDRAHGLQPFRGEGLVEFVLEAHRRLHEGFERDRPLLGADQLCEVRYEDLIHDPVGTLARVYAQLDLGGFDEAAPRIADYAARQKDFRPTQHELTPRMEALVAARWAGFIARHGHAAPAAATTAGARPTA